MTSTFSFPRLPVLVQVNVLNNLDTLDIFHFSQISTRTLNISTFIKKRHRELTSLTWVISYNQLKIKVNHEHGWTMMFQSFEHFEEISEHLLKVFTVENENFSLSSMRSLPLDFFIFKLTTTFNLVEFLFEPTQAQLRFALETLSINNFMLTDKLTEEFQYLGPLTMKILLLTHGTWLSSQSLMSMSCKKVDVHWNSLTNSDFNELIKKWLSGGLEELEQLDITINQQTDNGILEGITTVAFNTDRRPKYWDRTNLSHGRDIVRGDGMAATVVIGESFRFYVWHDKYMNVDE